MPEWLPAAGKVAVLEPSGGDAVLTGIVVREAGRLRVDLGASPPLPRSEVEVVASFFEPEALYRVHAVARALPGDNLVELDVTEVERVQRRAEPRARVRCAVTVEGGEQATLEAETVDLAGHGARLATDRPLPVGADATLVIQLPGDPHPVSVEARILDIVDAGDHWEERVRFLDGDSVDLPDLTPA